MEATLPRLDILPVDQIVPHEYHDEQRAYPLMETLRQQGILRNLVMPFGDGSGRYMILDGTNRVTAVRLLGVPHVIAQVVEPDMPGLALRTWNHVVWGMEPDAFRALLEKTVPSLQPAAASLAESVEALHARRLMLVVSLPDGRVLTAPVLPDDAATQRGGAGVSGEGFAGSHQRARRARAGSPLS